MAGVLTLNLVLQKSKIDDIRRIRKLNICAAQLQDVGVLRQAENIEVLSMSLNEISELGALSNCRRLTELYLRKNHLRDINQVLHLSRLPYLEVLNLSDNPISRDPNYRRFVIAAIPPLERLDERDITDDERGDALRVFPQLLSFAPPVSKYAQPVAGYTPPTVQERQALGRAVGANRNAGSHNTNNNNGAGASPASRQNTNASSGGRGAPIRKAPPPSVHHDPRAAPSYSGAAAAAAASPPARGNGPHEHTLSTSMSQGPSEEGVVQAVKVLCSELSPESLGEVRRFIDSMRGY